MGRIQKKCLEALAHRNPAVTDRLLSQGICDTISIAGMVFEQQEVSAAQHASVRRALGQLARKGLVCNLGRHWHDNCGRWALPEAGKAFLEQQIKEGWAPSQRPKIKVYGPNSGPKNAPKK